jgi:hypothetical protein
MRDGTNKAALEEALANSGVRLASEEVDAVARSLDRIQIAAATLLRSPSFDETSERFYRLLDIDASDGVDR